MKPKSSKLPQLQTRLPWPCPFPLCQSLSVFPRSDSETLDLVVNRPRRHNSSCPTRRIHSGVIFAAARWRALKLFVRLTSLSKNRCQETERRETVKRPFHLRVVSSGAWMFSAPAFLTHCPTKGLVARDAASGLSQTIWVTVRGGER